MTTPRDSSPSIDEWIAETNAVHASLGDSSRLRLAACGEIVSGRFGGLVDIGASTVALIDRDAEDDSIALHVSHQDRARLRNTREDAEIRLLARAPAP